LSFLIWGFGNLRWYMVFLSLFIGVAISRFMTLLIGWAPFVWVGWIPNCGLAVYLWFSKSS
jgi:hypothetical protein